MTALDQLITDTEAAITRLEERPGRHGGPVRQEIARLSYRLEVLAEARTANELPVCTCANCRKPCLCSSNSAAARRAGGRWSTRPPGLASTGRG